MFRKGPYQEVHKWAKRVLAPDASRCTMSILQSMRDSKLFFGAEPAWLDTFFHMMQEGASCEAFYCYWKKSAKFVTFELQCAVCGFVAGAEVYTNSETGATSADFGMVRAVLAKMLGIWAENAEAA